MALPQKLFNMDVSIQSKFALNGYPAFFSSAYQFNKASIGGIDCIVVESTAQVRPLQVCKVCTRIEENEGIFCVFFSPILTAYQRRSLSEKGVAWIIDDNTFYVPFLGASCMPRRRGDSAPKRLSMGAQAVTVRILDGSWDSMTTSQVARETGKSLSSISAYFAEIAVVAPEAIGSKGRTRFAASPKDSKERDNLLSKLEPFLQTPVKRRYFLVFGDGGKCEFEKLLVSGITALSRITMLADNPWETRAIAASQKDVISKLLDHCEVVTEGDSPDALLEIWGYEPVENDLVSLYFDVVDLAKSEDDERLLEAVDKLRERILK